MNSTVREHRWTIQDPPDPTAVARLVQEINVPEPIARILVHRGIDDYDKAKAYFRPSLEQLHDPFLLGGMEAAVTRIIEGVNKGERILVFGDYDVDGTNGAAMLYLFLKSIGATASFYIPDRIKEGYGISRMGIDKAKADGTGIFLSVDCGITAVDQVEYARSLGMDVIICDHHETGETLPDAYAVLDPIIPGDPYPFKSLCGCGVGFKLIQGVARRLGRESEIEQYLDFVTLASTADIVPLTGENRIITRVGMEKINAAPRPGIKALIDSAGMKPGKISTGQIVFVLAPRINAAGRLGNAMRAVQLLTATDAGEASALALELEEENRNRRKIDEDTFLEAQRLAESTLEEMDAAIVLHQEHWHPGVVGIVASRMVEKYYKPAIMMATVDGVAKGSARSVSGFDVYQALKKCEDKIIQFGGHKYAAGLTVEVDRLPEFQRAFNEAVRDLMTDALRTPEIRVDAEIDLRDVNTRFWNILREFAPFGPGNQRPVFLARDLEVQGYPRIVGKNHLRFRVRKNGSSFDAIGFNLGHLLPLVYSGRKDLSAVFTIEENDWVPPGITPPAEPVPQLKIKDVR